MRVDKQLSSEISLTLALTVIFGAGIGSEKPKNGSARLTNPFL